MIMIMGKMNQGEGRTPKKNSLFVCLRKTQGGFFEKLEMKKAFKKPPWFDADSLFQKKKESQIRIKGSQ
jgi:hypothetical protein